MQGGGELVSVVIPCYGQAHFLGEAIESVLQQAHRHFEIVVVDDGSPDNVSEVVARYPSVRCVRQKNQGVAAARNTGLRESTGSHLIFLDADDRLLPHALEAGLNCLRVHPECAFVVGRCEHIAADGSPVSGTPPRLIERDHYIELLLDTYIWMPAVVMYRRLVFESVGGFDGSVVPSEDYDLYLRIARNFPIWYHSEVVAQYRGHGANASANPERMLKATLSAYHSQWPGVKGNRRYEEAYKRGKRRWQDYYGSQLMREVWRRAHEGDWKGAVRGTLVLLRHSPQVLPKRAGRRLAHLIYSGEKLTSHSER